MEFKIPSAFNYLDEVKEIYSERFEDDLLQIYDGNREMVLKIINDEANRIVFHTNKGLIPSLPDTVEDYVEKNNLEEKLSLASGEEKFMENIKQCLPDMIKEFVRSAKVTPKSHLFPVHLLNSHVDSNFMKPPEVMKQLKDNYVIKHEKGIARCPFRTFIKKYTLKYLFWRVRKD